MLKKTYKKTQFIYNDYCFWNLNIFTQFFSERLKITLFYDKYLEFRTPQL